MRRSLVISVALAAMLAGTLAAVFALQSSAPQAARTDAAVSAAAATSAVVLGRCPVNTAPLPAEAIARAADQARIEAPALYKNRGPAVVELAWRAVFRLNVWAAAPFRCNSLVRSRTVVVDLLFPKMLPSASLSEGAVFVSLFPTGYQVWDVAH